MTPKEQAALKMCVEAVHHDYIEGYLDGRDSDAPEPNNNRSARYKHSFAVGRAEKENRPLPYAESMKRVAEIEAAEAVLEGK